MVTLSTGILAVFYGVSLITFLWSFVRGKEWTQIAVKPLTTSFKPMTVVLLPMLLLFGAAQMAGLSIGVCALYFAPAFLLPFILERINVQPWQRSLLLLMLSVAATMIMPNSDTGAELMSVIAGLIVAKMTNSFVLTEVNTLEDIIPSIVWLTVVAWTHSSGNTKDGAMQEMMVLGVLSTTALLRWVQRPLLHEDQVYLKRVMLSLVGGLTVLCLITKVVDAVQYPKIAIVAGVGFLFAYLLETFGHSSDEPSLKGFKQLVLIGILTVAASRVFGMFGLLVLAAAMPVVTARSAALLAAGFWCSRVMAQCFITEYNPNVTGVNLTHSYVSAALFAGFLLVFILSLFFRDIKSKALYLLIAVALSVILPIASNYFIHPEPTASLLIASLVACILLTVLAPAVYQKTVESHDTLILIAPLMAAMAMISHDLLELGEQSTNHDRLIVVGVLAFITLCAGIFSNFTTGSKSKPTALPAATDVPA